jgi:hypothetical protein
LNYIHKLIMCTKHEDPCFVFDSCDVLTVAPISCIFTCKKQLLGGKNVSVLDQKYCNVLAPVGIKGIWKEDILEIAKEDIISVFPDDTKIQHKGSFKGFVISDAGHPYEDRILSLCLASTMMICASQTPKIPKQNLDNINHTLKELLF